MARQGDLTMEMMRVMICGDLHTGHRVGLTHPKHQPICPEDAPHHLRKQANMRKNLWDWFAERVEHYRPIHRLIVNGDAVDGKGGRSGSTELLTADRDEQAQMAADAINWIGASEVYATYGTPYHVGTEEDWENVVVAKLDNFRKIEAEGHYECNGLRVVCKHYIGNTASPTSRATALSNAQIKQMLWALRCQQPLANLIVRSHVHRCVSFTDPGMNFAAWTTPALMGLGSKYGSRQCDGLPVDFGFLVVDVQDDAHWGVHAEIMPLSTEAAAVNKF